MSRSFFQEGERMFTNLLPYFKRQLKVCNLLATVPYEWDDKLGRFRVLGSKYKLMFCKFQVALQSLYTLLMSVNFVRTMDLNSSSAKMLGLVFLVCFVATSLMRMTFWKKEAEGALLLNSYIDFEKQFLPASKSSRPSGDLIGKVFIVIGTLSSFGLPGFMSTMILKDPCKPPHLGYILYKATLTRCLTPDPPIRLAILTFDTWMWFHAIAPSCFFSFNVFGLGLKCLDFYVQLLIRGTNARLSKRFRNQDHKNQLCFKLYRHLQVFAKLYNFVISTVFAPSQIAAACSVVIIGLYTCIKLHKDIPMPGFAFFPLLSLDGLTVISITQIGAGVFAQSKTFITKFRKSARYRRRTWLRKMALSSDFIKIHCSANYFDNLTPLVCVNFCLTQTVSLTLVS